MEDVSKIEALKKKLTLDLPEEYIPQSPLPQQHVFLWAPHDEVFYGGQAGGGKSSALLMAALQYVHHPGYNALLMRRTFADLSRPGSLMARAQEWLAPAQKKGRAHFNKQEKRWTFPSGSTLSFGYCDNENDVYNYQGAEFQFCGFDELTQFTQTMYLYLHSRLRKSKENPVPVRMRATGNPGGIGHQWVKERFIVQSETDDPDELEDRRSRLFIPSGLDDNPYVDEQYKKGLKKLDPVTRAQLLYGDWDTEAEGNLFRPQWFDGRMVPCIPPNVTIRRKVRYWDLASTDEAVAVKRKGGADYTASCLMALGNDGNVYVLEITADQKSPAEVEKLIKSKAERDGRVGTEIWIEREPGSSGEATIDHYRRYVLLGYNFRGDRPSGNKVERSRNASAAAEQGQIYLVQGSWNKKFINQAQSFPKGSHDDMVDAFCGAFLKVAASGLVGREYKPPTKRRKSIWG